MMGRMGYAGDDVVIRLSHDEALVLFELLHHRESQHRVTRPELAGYRRRVGVGLPGSGDRMDANPLEANRGIESPDTGSRGSGKHSWAC